VKLKKFIGIIVGLLFIVSAFIPLGPYHFEGEANITGALWNFMVPTGWLAIIVGVVLLFHMKLGLENKRLALFMFVAGLLVIVFRFQDVDYFLGLWHGVKGDFDVESWLLTPAPFITALTGVFAGLLLLIIRDDSSVTTFHINVETAKKS
jgi:hypothetical protein